MDEQLYVRIRGRVQGPFELERLQNLVRRGQLSRIHEVSTDQTTWTPAGDYPELFMAPAAKSAPAKEAAKQEAEQPSASPVESVSDAAANWYYSQGQSQNGPVTLSVLRSMVQSGVVHGDDLVWTDGMAEWTPSAQVPHFGALLGSSSFNARNGRGEPGIPSENTRRTLAESRPWVLFLVIFSYICAAFFIAIGIVSLANEFPGDMPVRISVGVSLILYGIVAAWAAQLLLGYYSRLWNFLEERTDKQLDKALMSLKSFWMFVSFVCIYLTVNAVVGIVWLISVSAALGSIEPN